MSDWSGAPTSPRTECGDPSVGPASVVATVGYTLLLLLAVMVPVAGFAMRRRRRLAPAAGSLKALPETTRALELARARVDPSLEPLVEAAAALATAVRPLGGHADAYARVLPMLEVMDGARSSPRVYPSHWIGELMDDFDACVAGCAQALRDWSAAWEATPERSRADLDASRSGARELAQDAEEGVYELRRIRSNAFSYAPRRELERVRALAQRHEGRLARLLDRIAEVSADPYR